MSTDLQTLQQALGHTFSNPRLLERALTHRSFSADHNERLEFLGDRVLGLTSATALFEADNTATEGTLAPRFNALVRQETCADVAREVGLGEVLKLGRSEMLSGGRRKEALLGDAMEAVIAAIYLDAGFEAARAAVLRLWGGRIAATSDAVTRDAKSSLQEWAQARGLPPPTYTETGREGPDHQPLFTVEARLEGGHAATGRASGKRAAEQAAARALLDRMEKSDD